jgi:DNA mismatch endonuclease (patch repair protein)
MSNKPTTDAVTSARMSRIRKKNTAPELTVRAALRRLGVHYRLHAEELPGTPDIVVRKLRKAIFVHGCYWHRHEGCRLTTTPKNNSEFWVEKFAGNVARDARKESALRALGWDVLVIWQCQTTSQQQLEDTLLAFISPEKRGQ